RLAIEARAKALEKEEPPAEEPPAEKPPVSNEDKKILAIMILTYGIQQLVLRAEARRAKKTFAWPPNNFHYVMLDEILDGLSRREITVFPEEEETSEGK